MTNDNSKKEISKGLNTAGMVLGILSIVFAVIFISAPLALLLGIVGLILTIIYKAKHGEKASGLVLSIIGTAISIFMTTLLVIVVGTVFTVIFNGMLGDWDCRTAAGEITSIGIGTNGYTIDGDVIDLKDFEIKDLNVTIDNGAREASVVLESNNATYTCTKQ